MCGFEQGGGGGGNSKRKEEEHNHSNYLRFSMDISNGKSIFEVKATIAINKVTILKNKATIALLFDSRATKTKAAIRICQSFLGTFNIMPPPALLVPKAIFTDVQ